MKFNVVVFTCALLSACANMEWNPVTHHVALEPEESKAIEISQISIHKAGNGVTIFGELAPRHLTQEISSGRVHIRLVSSAGKTLYEKSVPTYREGKLFKDQQHYSFSAAIPIVPPEGSTIRLRFKGDL